MNEVKLFDTTLRDGTQGEKVSLLVQNKLKITELLDDMGIHYIEGGGQVQIQRTKNTSFK